MKFTIRSVNKHGRLGLLSEIKRLPDLTFETPLLLIQTRKGSVPHLTHEVIHLAFKDHLPLLMPVSSTVTLFEQVREFGKGIAKFVGLQENFTFCNLHDPATETLPGYHVLESEAIWTPHGKKMIDAERYMDLMEAFQPDMYVAISDSDTDATSSNKRLDKSVKRSHSMFEICVKRHSASKLLAESGLLAGVGGGFDNKVRSYMAKEVAKYPVLGYNIEGLHRNSKEVDMLKPEDVVPAVTITLKELPESRLRVIPGAWNPSMVLTLISIGCDVFDSSLPYYCAERNSALIFPYQEDMIAQCSVLGSRGHEVSLSDPSFKEDLFPILETCNCLTCRHHTRAYIHHLINTKELLASVLLMIHNLHHYVEFFKTIRRAISNGTFDELKTVVATCHSSDSD